MICGRNLYKTCSSSAGKSADPETRWAADEAYARFSLTLAALPIRSRR